MPEYIVNISYLVASILFILALKGLSHPRTAVRGNFLGALGMLLAIAVTLWDRRIVSFEVILAGIIVGGLGSIPGVVVGMLILVGLPELLREFTEFRFLMYGILLIVVMLVKPEGFLPEATRKRELHSDEPGMSPADAAPMEPAGAGGQD